MKKAAFRWCEMRPCTTLPGPCRMSDDRHLARQANVRRRHNGERFAVGRPQNIPFVHEVQAVNAFGLGCPHFREFLLREMLMRECIPERADVLKQVTKQRVLRRHVVFGAKKDDFALLTRHVKRDTTFYNIELHIVLLSPQFMYKNSQRTIYNVVLFCQRKTLVMLYFRI